MDTLDVVFSTVGSTAAFILAASMGMAKGAPRVGRLYGVLLCLGVVCYVPFAGSADVCAMSAFFPVGFLAAGIPFFFWAWTGATMNDVFRLTPPSMVGAGLLVLGPFIVTRGWPSQIGAAVAIHSVLGVIFVIAALAGVLRTWREDLIEARRRMRLVVFVTAGAYTVVVLVAELLLRNDPDVTQLRLWNAGILAVLLLSLCIAFLAMSERMREALGWAATASHVPETPALVQPAPVVTRNPEQELIEKLLGLMSNKALYRNADLTVTRLASTLGVQERRLRELINRHLGHKNFSTFVNAYRLEEIRGRLADTRNDHLPILTLALEAGFGSIVAFNRAFKERYATTPTEYRAGRDGQQGNSTATVPQLIH